LGKLKWTPYEYYTSSPCEFYYACKGYFDERDYRENLVRTQTQFITAALGVKPSDFNKDWPAKGKQKNEITRVVVDEEMKETIRRLHPTVKI
jgi:hypothetical protein